MSSSFVLMYMYKHNACVIHVLEHFRQLVELFKRAFADRLDYGRVQSISVRYVN